MTINSLRIGRDLSNVAIKFQALPEETNRTRFDKIARFIGVTFLLQALLVLKSCL
jgi:hypothetical protein